MNNEQLARIREGKGFLAALDQSGGSTPKTLTAYGIEEGTYTNEAEMYALVHAMRSRIIKSQSFNKEHILGAILFKETVANTIEEKGTADYLWLEKGIVPFLKVDNGLANKSQGVQLMKTIPELDQILSFAKQKSIFGTKMRSVIHEYNEKGIQQIVDQQFDFAKNILAAGLVPIIEPEVSIESSEKKEIEALLRDLLVKALDQLDTHQIVMLKLTIPEEPDFYAPLIQHQNVIRVVALSGGHTLRKASMLLAQNHGLIASFSRALIENLSVNQTEETFDRVLLENVESIYKASIT